MQGAGQVSRGTFTVTTVDGKPTGTVLSENGDVEVGGKLLVEKTDILAELKKPPLEPQGELQVGAVGVTLAPRSSPRSGSGG